MEDLSFIEKMEINAAKIPRQTAVVSGDTGAKVTYEELYKLSGSVYAYLKKRGIGRESVVMISLPRGVQPFICLVGIWRAGAAAVLVETNFAAMRQKYIYDDAKCSLLIDSDRFIEIMNTKAIEGHEKTDDHDLAFLVYTSGTTGRPKGVMQEYGTQKMTISGNYNHGDMIMERYDRMALTAPLNFAATFLITVPMLYNGGTIVVFPMEYVRDPDKLTRAVDEFGITILFVTASLLKRLKELPDTLKKIITGGEPVRHVFRDDVVMYSLYAQSESCFNLASFRIDREYDNTPVGLPFVKEAHTKILDDEGNELESGQKGNVSYKAPYFRGYLGQGDLGSILINGYVNSGDTGMVQEDGNIVLYGRSDDMIKIRGNRVEPAEIEKAVAEVLGVDWVGVRDFTDNGTTYLAAYYTKEPKVSAEEAKKKLKKMLSSYMIPSFFIHIDSIPLNANGKYSRRELPKPDRSQYRTKYEAPKTTHEKEMCAAFEKALGTDKIGVLDDFYDMGGDSISVMDVIETLNWPLLDVPLIIKGRTPRKIAQMYDNGISYLKEGIKEKNSLALKEAHPLSIAQQYMFDYQCYVPKSTTWNLYMLLRLSPATDMGRLKSAVEKVLRAHPVFSTVYFFDDNSDLVQKYDPDTDLTVVTEYMSEAEFVDVTDTLVQPYKLIDSKLYRIRLIQTERGGYLFFDIHHSIADGTSIRIFLRDLCDAYEGKELGGDIYYLKLIERRLEEQSELYKEGKKYYEKLLDKYEWDKFPKIDHEIVNNSFGSCAAMIPIEDSSYDKLHDLYGLSRTAFFIAVTTLAIAFYNGNDNVRISWIFNGREKESDRNIIGTLIRDLYVGIRLQKDTCVRDVYEDVLEQIRMSIVYSCYPYPGPERIGEEGIDANLIYQSDLRNLARSSELKYVPVDIPKKHETADNLLDIEILETENGCKLYMEYIAECYTDESIGRFRRIYMKTACRLVEHMNEPEHAVAMLRDEVC